MQREMLREVSKASGQDGAEPRQNTESVKSLTDERDMRKDDPPCDDIICRYVLIETKRYRTFTENK